MSHADRRVVLWWGRFDPDYSRNRIIRKYLAELGWQVVDFHPWLSSIGDIEARLRRLPRPDIVWVPCFRQRDVTAASRWARWQGIPLLFDPLISAYDKQVDERAKLSIKSRKARALLSWECALFAKANWVLADTDAHANYFFEVLAVPRDRLAVIFVGAELEAFRPMPLPEDSEQLEVLFFGSFIPLQGPEVVVEAAKRYQGPNIRWTMLGNGPLRQRCEFVAQGLRNFTFEDWLPYAQLPERIQRASILLGIFGTTPKADRVIPNKVYQSLACGRPVVTRRSSAYPAELLRQDESGIYWVPPGDPEALARCVEGLAKNRGELSRGATNAYATLQHYFSEPVIRKQLNDLLTKIQGVIL
jgi:glycosyltransferase involved in cell wall biosynthesis